MGMIQEMVIKKVDVLHELRIILSGKSKSIIKIEREANKNPNNSLAIQTKMSRLIIVIM